MKVYAYLLSDPLLDPPVNAAIWGWEVDKVYCDIAHQSATEFPPQLKQLLADCAQAPPDYVLIRRLEELGSSITLISDRLQQLEALGITVMATQQDFCSGCAQPVSPPVNLMPLLGEIQTYQRRRRLQQGHAQNRLKALPPPGKAPYGYRRGKERYSLDRATAPVVKDFVEQFLLFGSLRGAVRYLEKKYGKKISVSTGRRWLTSPVYRGNLGYQNQQVVADTHPAIITREEAAQIDRLLRRNRHLPPRTASAPRSLAGLVTCSACQSSMKVTRVTKPRREQAYLYLIPSACPQRPKCKAIAYEQVLERTIQAICAELPQAVAALQMPPMAAIKGEIAQQIQQKQAALQQLPDLVESGILDAETADLRAYKLRTEMAEIQQKLAQLPPVNLIETVQTVSIPQFWLDLTESERRFYLREFIRQIQIERTDADWTLRLNFIF
ncbi:recombinase family protein [Almyronema epifaneia]|uniref:Recombinase family protein n=1 Tax=Almyronema epifaneia S1 TaxID=2991925 RepID=A0ABW6IE10_9CYAN